MFLKRANKLFSNNGSIASKLTLSYSLSTFILISVVAIFFYCTLVNTFYEADHQFLADEIAILKNILKTKPNDMQALKQEVIDIPHSLGSSVYHYYIRILNNNKQVVIQTPKVDEFLPIQEQKWQSTYKITSYLLKQAIVRVKRDDSPWLIQVVLDTSYQANTIKKYRRNVFIILMLGAIFSTFLGAIISRRGMKKLYELTEITKKITASKLERRINLKCWPQELSELGSAYNKMLARIKTSVSRLTELSDNLAHELRIPLSNIMGQTEIALSNDYSIEEYKELTESNLEELNRLYQIIENLLFLARAENPHLVLDKPLLRLDQEIHTMCKFHQALADEKEINFYLEGQASIRANTTMLRRMIGNILSNAIKYAPTGSEITINIEEINSKSVQIIVTDPGSGIAKEDLTKLFRRFYRTDTARASDTGGIGLGLAIVKSIVDLHHGKIKILSELNKGTSIIIVLPK